MKILFMLFTLFILLVMEMLIGNMGFYIPLTWLGVFYFLTAKFNRNVLLVLSIAGALAVDLLLYNRLYIPNILIMVSVFYYSSKCDDIWRFSPWRGGIFAPVILWTGYILLFLAALPHTFFSWSNLFSGLAAMITFTPLVYLFLTLLIFVGDKMQKKMKFDSLFVANRQEQEVGIYRKNAKEHTNG